MYVDWDIYISAYNKAKYEPSSKMIYAWSPLGGKYGGISALSSLAVNKYAFDNDGDALSLKISDGFSGIEKFTALTSNRDSAGYSGNGNDISTLLSYPQIDLLSGDSITLNFALVAGNTPQDLSNATTAALAKINANPNQITSNSNYSSSIIVHPNPTSKSLFIDSPEPIIRLEIINLMGEKSALPYSVGSNNSFYVDISNYPAGLYILKIMTSTGEYARKIVINH